MEHQAVQSLLKNHQGQAFKLGLILFETWPSTNKASSRERDLDFMAVRRTV